MSALFRIMALWRPQAGWMVAGVVLSLAALLAALLLMTQAGFTVGAAALGGALVAPVGAAVALRSLGALRIVLRYGERMATHDALFRALAALRVWFFRGLAARAAGGLGFRRAGDVLSRLVGDIEALDILYIRILVPLAGAALLLPVLAWVIGAVDVALAVVVVVLFALAAFGLPLLAARISWRESGRIAGAFAGLRIACLDTLAGLREVRAFGAEGRMLATVQGREAGLLAAQHSLATRAALAGAAAFLAGQAALLAVLVFALGQGNAALVAVAFLVVAAFEAVAILPRVGAGHAARAAGRVLEVADGPLPQAAMPPAPMPAGSAIRFDGVYFAWAADRPKVLDGLTLDIPQGSRVALLGPSGAGKSTLAALLLKVARPQEGRILLGGTDIAALGDDAVRARCAWLSQATHLFSDTIRANLALGLPPGATADDSRLWAALEAARLAEVVRALPQGLDTWLGEGGLGLSGGQGRRLALARALLSDAPILVLDEPCAGLDAATEREFFQALNEGAAGRTVLLIAHRLTGAERLDRIWRLSAGRAVAAAG
ncbi:MAG: thiol reductant ABC exporter subunit CydC [Alphaproteobacteria bacterium]|nr:thiol reductant ABC exporter subunit CydC [Alphaproteobacteria bacterium]